MSEKIETAPVVGVEPEEFSWIKWYSQGDSNPCYQDENLVS